MSLIGTTATARSLAPQLPRGTVPPSSTELPSVYLHPGHLFVSPVATRVVTILGSCVAVALWDGVAGVGGLNHFQLPEWVESSERSPRFGPIAIERLVDGVLAAGGSRARLQAKLFGGAHVLGTAATGRGHLGSRNVEVARRLLGSRGIPIVAEDVDGTAGRKLIVRTDDGMAWVKSLS